MKDEAVMESIKALAPHPEAWERDDICAVCGKSDRLIFRDDLSKKEYLISRMCQVCQDGFFVVDG